MTLLKLELKPDLYEHLRREANRLGSSLEDTATQILSARLQVDHAADERARAVEVLQQAGLLAGVGPDMKQRALRADMSLEEVRAALDASGGTLLSDLIIEMRGPKT